METNRIQPAGDDDPLYKEQPDPTAEQREGMSPLDAILNDYTPAGIAVMEDQAKCEEVLRHTGTLSICLPMLAKGHDGCVSYGTLESSGPFLSLYEITKVKQGEYKYKFYGLKKDIGLKRIAELFRFIIELRTAELGGKAIHKIVNAKDN